MTLELYFHPFASFCQKVLIALYENDTPFEPHLVDLGNEASRAAFLKIWPIGKFPVVRDTVRDWVVPESSIIIEYLDQHCPGRTKLVPSDPDLARQTRMRDRFFDLYVNVPMQRIVGDRLRPTGKKDPQGVEEARNLLRTALDIAEGEPSPKDWAMGNTFTMADCAAAPALHYANVVMPFSDTHPKVFRYLKRLEQRPSFARVLKEAEPYWPNFPKG
jgi:glutathione S-transferase